MTPPTSHLRPFSLPRSVGEPTRRAAGVAGIALVTSVLLSTGCAPEANNDHRTHATKTESFVLPTEIVTVGNDSRPAIKLILGAPLTWRVAASDEPRQLRLAVALDKEPNATERSHITFEVRLLGTGSEPTEAQTRLDFETWRLNPHWLPIEFNLPPTSQPTELEFRAIGEVGGDAPPVPVLSQPRLLTLQSGRSDRPNIVVFSLDTLRADRLSLYGYDRPTSPNIDRRAEAGGITFSNAIAAAPWTLPSHVSMLTGRDATEHGVNRPQAAPKTGRSLADTLSDAGYQTIGFTAGGYLSPEFGVGQGFHRQLDRSRRNDDSDEELEAGLDSFSGWLHDRPIEPFFAFFHTYEIHSPYLAREPYFSELAPGVEAPPMGRAILKVPSRTDTNLLDRISIPVRPWHEYERPKDSEIQTLLSALYDSGIAYTDTELERFWTTLEETGLDENTIVVITSDHGEALGDDGRLGHDDLHDEVLRVPLVIWLPQGRPHSTDTQVRSIDIVPTLLNLADVPADPSLPGRALIQGGAPVEPEGRAEPAWSYAEAKGLAARLENRTKYIWRPKTDIRPERSEELFDLLQDPREVHDLSRNDSGSVDRYRRGTEGKIRNELRGLHTLWRNDTDVEHRFRLRSETLADQSVVTPDCVGLERTGSGAIEVTIARRSECLTIVEQLAPTPMSVSLTTATAIAGHGQTLPGSGVTATIELGETDRYEHAWSDDLSLSASWVGERADDAGRAPEIDRELEEQLRALGYLN